MVLCLCQINLCASWHGSTALDEDDSQEQCMQLISLLAVNKCVKIVTDFKTLNNSQKSDLCLTRIISKQKFSRRNWKLGDIFKQMKYFTCFSWFFNVVVFFFCWYSSFILILKFIVFLWDKYVCFVFSFSHLFII